MTEAPVAIVRKIKATPRAVWHAFTEPEAMKQWFAPADGSKVIAVEIDVRAGGRYRVIIETPDGREQELSGVYREVLPGEKLVFTCQWKSAPESESVVALELTAAGDGTELLLRHDHFPDRRAHRRHEQAWSGRVRRLARLLA